MDMSELSAAKKAVGFNRTKKAVTSGAAKKVFAAADADGQFLLQIQKMCEGLDVEIDTGFSMFELGMACEIEVDCAVCAVVD
jgi:large subunit ribosomal protein L7A